MTTYTPPSEPGRTMPRDADTIVLTCRWSDAERPLVPLCAPTRGHAAPSGRGEPIAARSMSAVPAVTVARVVLSPGYQPPAPWRS